MLKIGCHLSSSKGYAAMGKEAVRIGANTFQFFTRNPRGGKAKDVNLDDIKEYLKIAKENNISSILAHAPYTLNACSADERLREFAFEVMKDDISRLENIPGSMYNFHPGSHVGQGVEIAVKYISNMLNNILYTEQSTMILLETMSGKGSEIGSSFKEIKEIINNVNLDSHLGVCIDTCHLFSAGYDIVNNLDRVLEEFDMIIGLNRLKAIHLNDSMLPLNSHKDRHAEIGKGEIGIDAIAKIINHPYLRDLPFYLETPTDSNGHAKEISLLKELYR